jgi:hypothetical protein
MQASRCSGVGSIARCLRGLVMKRRLYPPKSFWAVKRRERLEIVGYVCERCGAPDAEERFNPKKPHPFNAQGTPFRSYLQLAHKSHYERWNLSAECVVVCARCHGEMDSELRRKSASFNYAPVGLVLVWVYYHGGRYLAAEARRFDDLFEVVGSFEEGMKFELCPEIMMAVAGKGLYRRTSEGIEVLREQGVCRSFSAYLHEVLTGVLA